MANIQDLEKEIVSLQESIESALQKLQKPRGMFAKFAKISEFEEGNLILKILLVIGFNKLLKFSFI